MKQRRQRQEKPAPDSGETIRVSQGEQTAAEVVRKLDDGYRVVIDIDALGGVMQASLRECAGTYYCDTATKLLTYESRDLLQTVLRQQQLVAEDPGGQS